MKKKRFNSKSRTISNVEIDNSTTNEIVTDIGHHTDKYDSCNALVLPSKKRKTKNIDKKVSTTKFLSKKHRKKLEKVVERKQKKLERATLLEKLVTVQVPTAELQQYVSFTSLQNKGLKRHFQELETPESKSKHTVEEDEEDLKKRNSNSIKGSNKKKRLAILNNEKQNEIKSNPNVIGFEKHNYYFESDSSDDSNTDDESKDKVHVAASGQWTVDNDSKIVTTEINNERDTVMEDVEDKTVPNKTQKVKKIDENDFKEGAKNKTENKTISNKNEECEKPKIQIQQNTIPKNRTPAVFVPLNRDPEIQAARLELPIAGEQYDIIDMINENPVVIITGETGSGKTTQVPQFLYERGYAQDKMIGITEPRRVAAMSVSKRVAEEMNLPQSKVSYQIRFEGNITKETKIKFMTDGILLKEIQSDFLLTKYSVIILDEAHERTVYTDVLIGLLSKIVPYRTKCNNPLKLIIMSATLRIEEFVENTKLFKIKPPVFHVHTRQYEVRIHFNRKTSHNYVKDALRKAMMIHTRLPEGGILVFLTGQQEVETVVRKLREAFPLKKNKSNRVKQAVNKTTQKEASDEENSENDSEHDLKEALRCHKSRQKRLAKINLDNYSVLPTDDVEEYLSDGMGYFDEDDENDIMDFARQKVLQPLWVLPFYALLPAHKQAMVFKPPPEGCRLCVVCTNIAETSVTIPNIKYVVDSGYCKDKVYDKVTGVSMFKICNVSKAAATQRAGRAGRIGPGHCYRLYSSAVYDEFKEYDEPDILKKPMDDLLLQMKAMHISNVVNFPFPTPLDIEQLKCAEKRLTILGLLEERPNTREATYCTKLTPLGREISPYPIAPRYGKMLVLSFLHKTQDLLKYTTCMVAALSVQQVLVDALDMGNAANNKLLQIRQQWAGTGSSLLLGDPMVLLNSIVSAEYAAFQGRNLVTYCEENGLRHKAVVEVRKLRWQLTNEIILNRPDLDLTINPMMPPPTESIANMLCVTMLTGMADQVARKILPDEIKDDPNNPDWKYAYRTAEMEDPVFMHPTCILQKVMPKWVVYQEVYETNKIYMRGITAIKPEWLPLFARTQCGLSEPLTDPPPSYNKETGKVMCCVKGTFGRAALTLPLIEIEHPLNANGVKWFVYFFLDGQVCPKLKKFVPSLLSTPDSVNKMWAKLVPRIQEITQVMMTHKIITKNKLLETWASNKQFLLSVYQMWLPKSLHTEVALIWPPL